MASKERIWYPKHGTTRPNVVEMHGYCDIETNGTVLTTSQFTGGTFTGDTGVYTLTLEQPYAGVLAIHCTWEAGTAIDLVPQVKSQTPSTGVIVFDANAGPTPTDPSGTVHRMYVTLVLKRFSSTAF